MGLINDQSINMKYFVRSLENKNPYLRVFVFCITEL